MNETRHVGSLGAKAYLGSSMVAQLCALLRYTILARLLGPEQLGLSVTLILTSQFFESISDSGSDRFLIQDREGDDPRVQRLVHLLAIARGIFIATSLIVFSIPISHFYHQPKLAPAFVALAFSPLIAGFLHYDLRRCQRHKDFSREANVMLVGEIVGFAATTLAAYITRDFTSAIWGLIARSVAMVFTSWLQSERRYSAGYSAEHAKRLAKFATPLMANGFLLFFAAQGDRLLIGNHLGVPALGRYSAILLLVYFPGQIISRFVQAMHLPLLAAAARESEIFREARVDDLAAQALLIALALASGFALVAPVAVPLLYGRAFTQPSLIIALIGILQASRFIRLWPTTEALAIGRSGIVLANNIIRLIAFPLAVAGLMTIGNMVGLVIGFVIGELAALIAALILSNRAIGVPLTHNLSRIGLFVLACATIAMTSWATDHHSVLIGPFLMGTVATLAFAGWIERRVLQSALAMLRAQTGRRNVRSA